MSRPLPIVDRFRNMAVWNRGDQRAPHKPLLCLLAIAHVIDGSDRLQPFALLEKELTELLIAFGPPRKLYHPEYPFWFLQNDHGIWEVRTNTSVRQQASGAPTRTALVHSAAEGGFTPDVYDAIKNAPAVRTQIVNNMLGAHFPETLHDDILQTLNLHTSEQSQRHTYRNPQFRDMILSAYEYRCAICGFNVRIGQIVIALEAAHIKWYQAGGPDVHQNGLALCSLHHKLFDRGAFTMDSRYRALVSERAYGTEGFVEQLGRYHKKPILKPSRESYRPSPDFVSWHMHQVFLSPARE